ncbi:MAG: aquaporin [Planctomycetes bacterium]|nr:aquaporin [Planctomycetota bacterium]
MDAKQLRIFGIELVGAYALVLFSAGLVCINEMTTPKAWHQPGLLGVALGQGLILAALLALTAPITGGYLNPAITVMLWVFNRVETPRAAGLIGVQFAGSVLAALSLYFTFDPTLLRNADYGAPHINVLAYSEAGQRTQFTGAVLELLLTFFLVFAIFGLAEGDALKLGLVAGMIMTVCALFGLPLTGAALNPARWLGPTLLQALNSTRAAWNDSLVYLAGPVLGALAGGFLVFKVYQPAVAEKQ